MKKWKGYEHGVNLGGWLSQCDHSRDRYENFIREEDIRRIASWGLDHIRLPMDYNLMEDEEGNYKEDGFGYIDRTMEWCAKYKLNLILDLHKTCGFSFDAGEKEVGFFENKELQERFYRLWEELARRYGGLHENVAFELLNEITDKSYGPIWNDIAAEAVRRIRKLAPETKILIGGYWNNSVESVPDILLPPDANIIYNFHCYEPLIFTHQGAPWIPEMDVNFRIRLEASYRQLDEASKGQLNQITIPMDGLDPEKSLGEEYFERTFSKAVAVAEERGVALYCGEYGVINRAEPEDALNWYRIIRRVFDRFGIGRAAWSYREMDFGLVDAHMAGVIGELVKEL
ncbi:MAG: cellulase family glycosylhydrolase [Lachnospiraceae bacterium]|nr:cellulase family glycosylhydrolase [Lachnospiraceae bacterium]